MCNARQYTRLERHFLEVSSVLGIDYNDEMNSVVYHIGRLLSHRNITKDMAEYRLNRINGKKIYHKDNQAYNFKYLYASVESMYKEASALHVRAQSFKANKSRLKGP